MSRHRAVAPSALVGAAVVGAIAALALRGVPAPAVSRPPAATTATVVRTDLATTVLTAGSLGYAPTNPLVNRVSGTYTWLPSVGAAVQAGQVLYRVDNEPVVMMVGSLPAWRTFTSGMTDGPDVGQLETNLIAFGDARGLFTEPSDHFSSLTTAAIDRWQAANGLLADGQIPLGAIAFFPQPLLVGAPSVELGEPASVGDTPYAVTTATRTVTVPLTPNDPTVPVGERVSVLLPSGASTSGVVSAIGPAAPTSSGGSGNGGAGGGGSGGGANQGTSTVLTVTPDDPAATGTGSAIAIQVSLTVQSVRHVLALPISALLALANGGYGVEVVPPSGPHRLIGVTTGVFAGGRVQISGSGITAGTKVVVAQ